MFLVAVVLVLSVVYGALSWNISFSEGSDMSSLDDIMEDIDFDKLKKDYDMVAALTEIDLSQAVSNIVVAAEVEQVEELLSSADEDSGQGDREGEKTETVEPLPLFITPINDSESLVVVESMPEFPGGATAFMKWLTENIKYPATARDKKIEGRVVVSFIIDVEGNPTKLRLEESSDRLLGSLVMSVLGKMPKWKPGVQNGQLCPTMIRVPINFEL